MKNKNIFEKNAMIPDIVQQKANAAFATIYTRQDEPAPKPQKIHKSARATIIKIASTVVVAATTIAVLFGAISYFGGKGPELPGDGNQFTIRVCASELESETPLPISLDVSNQTFGYYVDWTGCSDFQINFPISVEGENISTVTFKAGNAFFEVVNIDCPSIVKSGLPLTIDDFSSTYVDGYDVGGHPIGKTEVGYYDLFSADYDTLQNSKYLLNICNVLTDRMDLYYILSYEESEDDYYAGYTYLLKDVEVTIEVTFNDGTTSSRSLGLFANQYLATDILDDGTEYSYDTMQIFCYDKNAADDATKQLISNQITHAMELCKAAEAEHSLGSDTTDDGETFDGTDANDGDTGDDTEATVSTDTSEGAEEPETTDEVSSNEITDNINYDDYVDTSEDIEFDLPGFDSRHTIRKNEWGASQKLEKSGKDFRINLSIKDSNGFFDISLRYGDIKQKIESADLIIAHTVVERDADTAFAILIIGQGDGKAITVVYEMTEQGIIEIQKLDGKVYSFPDLK
ncbi:MAG: hypothetical protein K5665_09555 [Saccharofermentans sp.]|nr:hypothetical protein [Saccharofermentans sp.]